MFNRIQVPEKANTEAELAAMQAAGAAKYQFEIDSTLPFSDRGFAFNKGNYLVIDKEAEKKRREAAKCKKCYDTGYTHDRDGSYLCDCEAGISARKSEALRCFIREMSKINPKGSGYTETVKEMLDIAKAAVLLYNKLKNYYELDPPTR